MKKLTILLFSILISFNSYGEWKYILETIGGNTYYVDKDTIKEDKGYVYFWYLDDYTYSLLGTMSEKRYIQVDCGVNRFKTLSFISYLQPMGGGWGETMTRPFPPQFDEWNYPPPDDDSDSDSDRPMLKYVCNYIK